MENLNIIQPMDSVDSMHNPSVMCAIVTFNGEHDIVDCVSALRSAAPWTFPVLLVDNASTDQTAEIISGFNHSWLHLMKLEKNLGVAAAYNLALQKAKFHGARWLFILDQDSRCSQNCLSILYEQGEALGHSGQKAGAVCPTIRSRRFPHLVHMPYLWDGVYFNPHPPCEKQEIIRVDSGISSGTLYLVEALDEIGGFREDFFIDFVDHECHLRLGRQGWSMWWIRDALLKHELGKRQIMTPEGIWIEHDPFRYYYIVRNMLEGCRIYGGYRSVFSFIRELWGHTRKMRRYGNAPNTCMAYMAIGMIHKILGRFGPLSEKKIDRKS